MRNKKEEFFQWFRENRKTFDDETMRWAEHVAREFTWHDKLEQDIKNSSEDKISEKTKEAWLTEIMPQLDGLDARLQKDTSLRFRNRKKRNDQTRHADKLLTRYYLTRPDTELRYDSETDTLTLRRTISGGNHKMTLAAKNLPVYFYPELASKCDKIPESKRNEYASYKYEKQKLVKELYRAWKYEDQCAEGYQSYNKGNPNTYRIVVQ